MSFDPAAFMEMSVKGSNSTRTIPVPVGEYVAIISKCEPRQWQSKDGTKSGVSLDITWEIDDANLKAELGRDKVTVRQGVMLDLTEKGMLKTGDGENVALGRLREAVGKNDSNSEFSFSSLPGLVAKVFVSHRVDGDEIYSEVKKVVAVG